MHKCTDFMEKIKKQSQLEHQLLLFIWTRDSGKLIKMQSVIPEKICLGFSNNNKCGEDNKREIKCGMDRSVRAGNIF